MRQTARILAAALVVGLAASVLLAAGSIKRARPPKWTPEVANEFFPDAREKLNGERPAASGKTSGGPASTSGGDLGPAASGGSFAWSRLITSDTLEDEVKSLQSEINQTVQTPTPWKGGGYRDGRAEFSLLAAMFAVIGDFDGEVRWKKQAHGMRDLIARAGFNCKVGTDASYNEAKLRKDDMDKLMRGEAVQLPSAEAQPKWDKVSGRPPLMQRLEKAQQQGVSIYTADAGEFKKHGDKLIHEAQIIAVLAEMIQREGFEYSDDETYLGFARQMRDRAVDVAEAAKQKNYDGARKAAGEMTKACSNCHEGYRS